MRGVEPWWRIAERYGIVSIQTCTGLAPGGDRPAGPACPLPSAALSVVVEHCEPRADVQVIIDRGRADVAVRRGLSVLMPELLDGSARRGLSVGRPIAVHAYRVGVVDAIARVLDPRIVVLISGTRRTCASRAQMSAVVAVCPRPGVTSPPLDDDRQQWNPDGLSETGR